MWYGRYLRDLTGVLDSQLSVKMLVISQLSVKILAISQLSVNFDRSHSQLTVKILATEFSAISKTPSCRTLISVWRKIISFHFEENVNTYSSSNWNKHYHAFILYHIVACGRHIFFNLVRFEYIFDILC